MQPVRGTPYASWATTGNVPRAAPGAGQSHAGNARRPLFGLPVTPSAIGGVLGVLAQELPCGLRRSASQPYRLCRFGQYSSKTLSPCSRMSARLIDDPDHSADEDRFVLLDLASSLRLLVVAHCYRVGGSTIRIISARKATREEQRFYLLVSPCASNTISVPLVRTPTPLS